MAKSSIGARLTFWYTIILGVILMLVGIMAYGLLSYSLSQDVNVALQGVAQVIVHQIRTDGRASQNPDVDELFRRFFGFAPSDRYFGMLNPGDNTRGALRKHPSHYQSVPVPCRRLCAAWPPLKPLKGQVPIQFGFWLPPYSRADG